MKATLEAPPGADPRCTEQTPPRHGHQQLRAGSPSPDTQHIHTDKASTDSSIQSVFPPHHELAPRPQRHEACRKEAWSWSCNRKANCSSWLPPTSTKTRANAQHFPWKTSLEQTRGDPERSRSSTCSTARAARSVRSIPHRLPRLQPTKQPGAPRRVSVQRQLHLETTGSCFAATPRESDPGLGHHIRQLSRLPGAGRHRCQRPPLIVASGTGSTSPAEQPGHPSPAKSRCPTLSLSPFAGGQTGHGTARPHRGANPSSSPPPPRISSWAARYELAQCCIAHNFHFLTTCCFC